MITPIESLKYFKGGIDWHWWDFFRLDKYHMINGEEGYGNSSRKISE